MPDDVTAEVRPGQAGDPPKEPDRSKDAKATKQAAVTVPGWPQDRFHPVYGRRPFADPNEYATEGGDDGDWRFKTAGAADQARTETEAQLAMHYNMRRKAEAIDAEGRVPVSNSVQAHEAAANGYPEPGVVLPKGD